MPNRHLAAILSGVARHLAPYRGARGGEQNFDASLPVFANRGGELANSVLSKACGRIPVSRSPACSCSPPHRSRRTRRQTKKRCFRILGWLTPGMLARRVLTLILLSLVPQPLTAIRGSKAENPPTLQRHGNARLPAHPAAWRRRLGGDMLDVKCTEPSLSVS